MEDEIIIEEKDHLHYVIHAASGTALLAARDRRVAECARYALRECGLGWGWSYLSPEHSRVAYALELMVMKLEE